LNQFHDDDDSEDEFGDRKRSWFYSSFALKGLRSPKAASNDKLTFFCFCLQLVIFPFSCGYVCASKKEKQILKLTIEKHG
jgi:hypothetical protein